MRFINEKKVLAEISQIFSGAEKPVEAAAQWVRGVAQENDLDPVEEQVRLIREVRRANPDLDLETATYLAGLVAQP